MRRVVLAALLAVCLSACSSSSSNGEAISRSDLGEAWPLTVDSGTLHCEGAGAVTFSTEDGTTYAVNGLAKGMNRWTEIDSIWADAPGGLKKNIGPLIQRGLALCEE